MPTSLGNDIELPVLAKICRKKNNLFFVSGRCPLRNRTKTSARKKKDSLSVPDSRTRRRSASFGGRLPFFDFSMIPDKDPNYKEIVRKKPETKNDGTSDVVVSQDAASLVAAALTMAANSEMPAAKAAKATTPKGDPPKLSFFDYTMFPDKNPGTGRQKK